MLAFNPEDLKTTNSDPDGPFAFVDFIGFEVPTYIDPRFDLIPQGKQMNVARLEHHVPLAMRGNFLVSDLPDPSMWQWEVDKDGFAICTGKRKDGTPCRQKAVNRSKWCFMHGGALHPGDRVIDFSRDIVPDAYKVTRMTRLQKVEIGAIPVQDLSDEEIAGLFVLDDDGRKVKSKRLSEKIHSAFVREMMSRMQDFMQMKAPVMLEVISDIAENDLNEPADRFKAAQWLAERTLGKTPEVVIHGKTDKPYEQIFTSIETTTLAEFEQRQIESGNIIEAEVVPDGDNGQHSDSHTGVHNQSAAGRSAGDGTTGTEYGDSSTGFDFSGTGLRTGNDGDSQSAQRRDDLRPSGKESGSGVESKLTSVETRKNRLKEQKAKLRSAKNRRYAKRAMGLTSDDDHPWLADFKPIRNSKGQVVKYAMRLVLPDDQTEDVVARIQSQDALEAVAMTAQA